MNWRLNHPIDQTSCWQLCFVKLLVLPIFFFFPFLSEKANSKVTLPLCSLLFVVIEPFAQVFSQSTNPNEFSFRRDTYQGSPLSIFSFYQSKNTSLLWLCIVPQQQLSQAKPQTRFGWNASFALIELESQTLHIFSSVLCKHKCISICCWRCWSCPSVMICRKQHWQRLQSLFFVKL